MLGVFHRAIQHPNCTVESRFYKAVDEKYPYICYGNIGARGCITNTKYKRFAYEIGDLPESSYAPAKLKLSDVELGIIKYFNPVLHWSHMDIFEDLTNSFPIPLSPSQLCSEVFKEFNSYFGGLDSYIYDKLPFDRVHHYMTHDISGNLRTKTSAGIGFKHDRKYIARNHIEDVRSVYELDTYDFDIYWYMFLKDELRQITKNTRSISLPQLHLWIIAMAHFGGIYEWFSDTLPDWCGYGLDDKCSSWHSKLRHFQINAKTYGYDIRQQDSKMSPGFISFIELWLKSKLPVTRWNALEWYLNQTFYDKRLVDSRGNILQFSQGEPSGNPFTIIFNIFDTLFKQVCHAVIARYIDKDFDESKEVFIIMGDDVLKQTSSPDLYRKVVHIIGNELTTEEGNLLNDVTFLSQKITIYKGQFAPYYANLDKMFASLQYTTSGMDEYFSKMCSFYNMLIYAPPGSPEREWKTRIQAHIEFFIQSGFVKPALLACYKPSHLQKRERAGMVYHSCTPRVGGRVEKLYKIFNMVNKSKKNFRKKNNIDVAPAKPQDTVAKQSYKPSTKRKKKVNKHTSAVLASNGLTKNEMMVAKEYVTQLLWPTRPIKLVRPIPVRSFAYFKAGEITFTSPVQYTEVQFRPHPWRFIELKTQAATHVVNMTAPYVTSPASLLPQESDPVLINGSTLFFSMTSNLRSLSDAEIQFTTVNPDGFQGQYIAIEGHILELTNDRANGYYGMTTAGTMQFQVANNSARNIAVAINATVFNSDGTISGSVTSGLNTVLGGATSLVTSSSFGALTCTSEQVFCPIVSITNNSGGNINIKDLSWSLVGASQPVITTGSPVSTVYSFGRALYPADADLASEVMSAFSGSNLWSPVAMACLFNISQELQKAGGRFQATYLPSYISTMIPNEFSDAWTTLNTWKGSYPHFEGPFRTGAHASWVGARILDYEFTRPFASDHILETQSLSLPSDVFMSQTAATGSDFKYYLSFAACFEIQSVSPNFTMTLGPSSALLMPQLLALLSISDALVGENPDHMKRIKSTVTRILADPIVKEGFKTILRTAGTAAMALLL